MSSLSLLYVVNRLSWCCEQNQHTVLPAICATLVISATITREPISYPLSLYQQAPYQSYPQPGSSQQPYQQDPYGYKPPAYHQNNYQPPSTSLQPPIDLERSSFQQPAGYPVLLRPQERSRKPLSQSPDAIKKRRAKAKLEQQVLEGYAGAKQMYDSHIPNYYARKERQQRPRDTAEDDDEDDGAAVWSRASFEVQWHPSPSGKQTV